MPSEPEQPEPLQPAASDELPAACALARSSMAAFVGRHADRASAILFRDHLEGCKECKRLYHQTVAAAANMGRNLREGRDDHERVVRKAGMAKRVKQAIGEPGRRNRYALRLALLPTAFALLIFLQRAIKPQEGMTLHWQGGEVHVGDQRLNAEFPRRVLNEEGLYCSTRGNARALIFAHSDSEVERFEMGLECTLQVLDPSALKLRLASGELLIKGPASVLSQYGMLEVQSGEARLLLRDLKFRLECIEGELKLITSEGERELSAGMQLELGP